MGLAPAEIISLYTELSSVVFRKKSSFVCSLFGTPSYDTAPLANQLRSVFGKTKMGNLKKQLVVFATRLDDFSLQALDSSSEEVKEIEIVDVLLASTAAPTYFNAHTIVCNSCTYVDGGLAVNNPIRALSAMHDLDRVLSIGCGAPPKID